MLGSSLIHRFLERQRKALVYLGRTERDAEDNLLGLARDRAMRRVLAELQINCAIDVGANTGQFAKSLRGFGYAGRIVSFEPGSEAFESLRAEASDDPEWMVHKMALGRTPGRADLSILDAGTNLSTLLKPAAAMDDLLGFKAEVRRVESVAVDSLDHLFPTIVEGVTAPRCLLKVDTQGFDREVLAGGAERCVPASVVLLTEVAVKSIYEGAPRWHETIEEFLGAGWGLAGLFPCAHERQSHTVMEFDCLMVRSSNEATNRPSADGGGGQTTGPRPGRG